MQTATDCPKCQSENIYQDGHLWICPECSHEWTVHATAAGSNDQPETEDTTVVKELKIKGDRGRELEVRICPQGLKRRGPQMPQCAAAFTVGPFLL